MIHACEVGCLDHVKLFLRHGVEVMHKDIDGFTAEEIAMVSGYDEITKIIREQTLLKGPQELKTNTTYSSFEDSQLGFPASYDDG